MALSSPTELSIPDMNEEATPAIAFTIDSLKLGGAERTLLRWAVWCRDAGWRVLVVTRHGPERDAYPLPQGLTRRLEPPLPGTLSWLGWWAFPARLLNLRALLRSEAVDVVVGVTVLPAVKLLLATRNTAGVYLHRGPVCIHVLPREPKQTLCTPGNNTNDQHDETVL